ncbi:MAG: thiamine phosphate synthase [Candidatus Sulfotelmatobacter sp.]|jgi:thiamine-phosphate pyrophosphorylase
MAERYLLYYITDRTAFPGDEHTRRHRLLDKIAEAASVGVNYIQLREKDLSSRDLESLAREAIRIIRDSAKLRTALLINARTDVALATAAAGVHLPAHDVSAAEVRKVWNGPCGRGRLAREISPRHPVISVSCHTLEEVAQAAADGATLAVFAPVFEKRDAPGATPTGLDALRQACRAKIPVLALGGITLQNAESCLRAGAAGIAAIRLFQENDIAAIVRTLGGH